MMPVTKRIAKLVGGIQRTMMKAKDERLKVNNEALTGAKVIKMQAWEKSFESKILALRDSELDIFRK